MKYNAFISYRHTEPDIYVAKTLQQKLEHFKLPKSLRKKYPKERWRINRIFRDQDELSLSENLSEELDESLKDSEYLIAICSPRYKESEWCNREIDIYTKMYGLEKTLLVLVEGEPEDSFPENQLYRDKVIKDDNGNTEIIREDVEPLAADVRGNDKKEINRKIDDAVIRLAAMMYGLDYDDLRRRHREQRIRRIAGIASIVAGVFFIFGLVCLLLFMRINSLSNDLEDSNKNLIELNKQILENDKDIQEKAQEIERKNGELAELNDKLNEQYVSEQIKYAVSTAENTINSMRKGRFFEGLVQLRNAMPDTKEDNSKPYVAKTEFALSKVLFEYEFDVFVPEGIVQDPTDEEEYDDFWVDYTRYFFLQEYLGGDNIVGAGNMEDGTVLIITDRAGFYWYKPEEYVMDDVTVTWFDETFDSFIERAAYRDGKLYIKFNKNDYVTCFSMKPRVDETFAGEIGFEDFNKVRHIYMDDENPVKWSDDGKIRIEYVSNRTVNIFRGDETEPVNTLYDHNGKCYGIYSMEGTGYYAIIYGYDGYILNENLEEIAKVRNYYGYSSEDNTLLQFRWKDDRKGYYIYKYPFRSYEELISEADELLDSIPQSLLTN